jgi:predicted KAP-like P-loop ATPase
VPLDPDRPIVANEQDLLGRQQLVARLADWVREAPLEEGFVIGLTGPWGSGKTSVLNLLEESLEPEAIVVWFEPWLFSDADQLVTRFFDELSAQLKGDGAKRLCKLGTRMADYGAALSPAASVVLGPAGQIAGAPKQLASMQAASASAKRREIRAALQKRPQRIVVLIDDLDRLDPHEVGEVLRLVKLVADLPGIVHVLSYDRPRVERALELLCIDDGNAYLQKIVQASMGVPPIPRDQLRTMSMDWLQQALGERDLVAWWIVRCPSGSRCT